MTGPATGEPGETPGATDGAPASGSGSAGDPTARSRLRRPALVVLGAVVAFLTIVAVAQLLPGRSPTTAAPETATAPEAASAPPSSSASPRSAAPSAEQSARAGELEFVRRDADDPMAIGDVDAPVVMTAWTDPRCPYCALFSRDTLPTLVEDYVDTGRVRIEYYDVAYFGKQSETAAVAARAAADQDKYMEFMTAIYDAAPEQGHPDLPREKLIDFAERSGVPDIERFAADLDDPDLRDAVQADTRSAQQLGVTSVPFFVSGKTALAGAQPTSTFKKFLDQSLAEAE